MARVKLHTTIKDITPPTHQSDLIYKIDCQDCNGTYIGQTSQYLKDRLAQHSYDCTYKKTTTALAKHHTDRNHKFDFENPTILDKESNKTKRNVLEMYHIATHTQTINFRTDTDGLNRQYKNILNM